MAGDQEKAWVRAIGKKLRDDLGDCPSLPEDMLRLLEKLKEDKNRRSFEHPQGKSGQPPSRPRR
jgi:hypothetical protein